MSTAGIDLSQKSVLVACCGFGPEIDYLRDNFDVELSAFDINERFVDYVRDHYSGVDARVEDLRDLSYADNSFDYAFVVLGLHHLTEPFSGFYELLRVSRYGLIAVEPYDSWLRRFTMKVRMSEEYEVFRNYAYAFSKREIRKTCLAMFTRGATRTFFAVPRMPRNRLELWLVEKMSSLLTCVVPWLGNRIAFIVEKPAASREEGGAGTSGRTGAADPGAAWQAPNRESLCLCARAESFFSNISAGVVFGV